MFKPREPGRLACPPSQAPLSAPVSLILAQIQSGCFYGHISHGFDPRPPQRLVSCGAGSQLCFNWQAQGGSIGVLFFFSRYQPKYEPARRATGSPFQLISSWIFRDVCIKVSILVAQGWVCQAPGGASHAPISTADQGRLLNSPPDRSRLRRAPSRSTSSSPAPSTCRHRRCIAGRLTPMTTTPSSLSLAPRMTSLPKRWRAMTSPVPCRTTSPRFNTVLIPGTVAYR